MQLRSGTWSIVFTDLVDSTAQRTRIGDDAADALRREHDRIVGDAIASRGGKVVKGTGDGAMVAFDGAADALAAAVAVQQRVERRNRAAVEPLGLRVGIAIGDAVYEDDDLHGTAVVEAQRICATANAGEVLLSAMVRSIAGSRAEATLVPIGSRNLKGLPEPVDIWRAEWSALDEITFPFPALLAPDTQLAFGGRATELDRLLGVWKDVLGGGRRAVFVSGEPGIGKTRLAAETARAASVQSAVVLYGCCDEGLNTPHQPFVEALDYYLARADQVDVGSFPGELSRVSARVRTRVPRAPEPISADPDVEQYRLFEAMSSWLAALTRRSPVVLVVDDMHWASRPTVLMLRHIVRTVIDDPLLVIATYRDTDLDDDHPLNWALSDLRSLAGVDRLPLVGLDEPGVVDLLERVSKQHADASLRALARRLHSETEGNPLFIGEVLRHLAESGRLEQRDGRWIGAADGDGFGIPDGVKEVIGQRLHRLGPNATEVLQIASCIGRDFPIDLLIAVGGRDVDIVLDVVDSALSARLVEEAEPDQYRFTHALVRSTLLERLSAARRMRVHRRIAEELEAWQPGNATALAYQWCEASTAGDARRAIAYSRRAADAAAQQAAFDEAVALLERASAMVADPSIDDETAGRLWVALGDARMTSGRVEAARDAYVEGASHLPDRSPELVHIALSFHGPSRAGHQDDRHAMLAHRALAGVDENRDPATAARVHAQLSLMHDKWAPAQLDEAMRAVELATRSGDPRALCDAYRARFWTAEPGRSSDYAEASLAAARDGAPAEVLLNTFVIALIGAAQRGDYERFGSLAREHATLAEESRLPIARGLSRCILATMHVTRAELAAAESLTDEALEITDDQTVMLSWGVIRLQLLRMTERRDEAAAMLRSWLDSHLVPESGLLLCEAALALCLAEGGRRELSQARFDDLAANRFARVSDRRNWLHTGELATLSDLCAALGDRVHAEGLIDLMRPWEHDHLQVSVSEDCGPTALHLGRLECLVGRLDDAVAHLERALAETTSGEAWWKACESKLELGKALLKRGDGERAAVMLDEARTFAQGAGLLLLARQAEQAAASPAR
jgi:class 3 adenylate cyclase/tetratricopeptide (TPR) repeat protein